MVRVRPTIPRGAVSESMTATGKAGLDKSAKRCRDRTRHAQSRSRPSNAETIRRQLSCPARADTEPPAGSAHEVLRPATSERLPPQSRALRRRVAHSHELVLKLVGMIYDAGADPSRWPVFLTLLADVTHGTSAALYTDLSYVSSNIGSTVEMDPYYLSLYTQYYVTLNDLTPRRLLRPEGWVGTRRMFCSDGEMLHNEYYMDFLRHQGCFHSLTGLIFKQGQQTSNIDVFRPFGQEDFSGEDIKLLRELMPHLQCSLRLHQRIESLEHQLKATEQAMDALPVGIVFLDDSGKVVSINAAARAIFGKNDGLVLDSTGIIATLPRQSRDLRALVAQACHTSRGLGVAPGGSISISRPSLCRPYSVLVCPAPRSTPLFAVGAGLAVVFITDPETRVETLDEVARRAFSMTQTEAAVAARLVSGETIGEIAEALHITRATVRTHLHQIFFKTDTHRQSDLIRLLVTSPAALHLASPTYRTPRPG